MTARTLATALLAVVAAVLGTLLLVAAPESPPLAFFVGLAGLAAAFVALALAVRGVVGRSRQSAGLWFSGATIPVALLWLLFAFVQTLTASFWPWKLALVLQVLAGAVHTVIALVAGAAASASDRDERTQAGIAALEARIAVAAQRVLEASAQSRQRVRIDAAVRPLLRVSDAVRANPVAADALGSDLERLALVLARNDEAEAEALLAEVERARVR
jgi:hypothetical protein